MSNTPKNTLKLRLFLFSLLALVVLFLVYKAIVPFGKITYTWKACDDDTFFITKLKPEDRVEGKCGNKIIGDPVYFNLKTSRTFNTARVILKYKSDSAASEAAEPLNTPIIELGIQADAQKHYRLKPVENKIIDDLDWERVEDGEVILLQREQKFNSIDDFLQNLPPRNEIALYNYDLPLQKVISEYHGIASSSQAPPRNDIRKLRGSYQFYTYTENEDLDFEFEFSDLNIDDEPDLIKVIIYYNNTIIEQKELPIVGTMRLKIAKPSTGFYKIAVETDDNVITEKIITSQKILSFINRIWLAHSDSPDLTSLYTDSSEIFVRTINPASLQKIMVGAQVLTIDETYKQFSQITETEKTKIQFAKDDLIIAGNGMFSFSEDALDNPGYRRVNKNTDVNKDGINYILANYQKPETQDGWQVQTVEFDLRNSWREKEQYGFIISVPGLRADPSSSTKSADYGEASDEVEDWIEMGEIKVELEGKTLWRKIREILTS